MGWSRQHISAGGGWWWRKPWSLIEILASPKVCLFHRVMEQRVKAMGILPLYLASAPGGFLWPASLAHHLVQNDLPKWSKWFLCLYGLYTIRRAHPESKHNTVERSLRDRWDSLIFVSHSLWFVNLNSFWCRFEFVFTFLCLAPMNTFDGFLSVFVRIRASSNLCHSFTVRYLTSL